MTVLLTLLTGFGYMLGAIFAAALAAYCARDAIVAALDATIPWPEDEEPAEYASLVREVQEGFDTLQALHLQALSELPMFTPVWDTQAEDDFPHGISLAILRSHPEGASRGFDAAYVRWKARQAHDRDGPFPGPVEVVPAGQRYVYPPEMNHTPLEDLIF